jgi:hypothetical protein
MLEMVGIAKGTLSDDKGGKLGAAIPAFYVRELIEAIDSRLKK